MNIYREVREWLGTIAVLAFFYFMLHVKEPTARDMTMALWCLGVSRAVVFENICELKKEVKKLAGGAE